MASFNRVILLGNLTRDPQVRYIQNGTAVTEIGLAVNRTWFDKQSNQRKEEVTFVDVTLWGRTAEIAGEYLAKGRSVLIEGHLKLDSWNDKETGQKRSKLHVVGESMTMVGGREGGGGGGPGGGGGYQGGQQRGGAGGGGGGGGRPQGRPQPAPQGGGWDDGGGRPPAEAFYEDAPGGPPDMGGGGGNGGGHGGGNGGGGSGAGEEVPF